MKILKSLTSVILIVAISSSVNLSFGQVSCIDDCLKECSKEEDKCIEKAQLKWSECYYKCNLKYPFWGDHGYYGDVCKEVCDEEFEEALADCIFYGDLCIDVCDEIDEDCLCNNCKEGFTYEASSDKCVLTIPNGYEIFIDDDRLYIEKDCNDPINGCCPAGWETAWDQLCTSVQLKEECRDEIRDIENEAGSDEAQGDPIDWTYINGLIDDILNDPDCYDVERNENCDYCFLPSLENTSVSNLEIDGNKVKIKPYCDY